MVSCSACGTANPDGSIFCGLCGARLSQAEKTAAAPRLRAMGVGDILDETIRLYRQNFRTFVGISAVLQIPLVVLQLMQSGIVGPTGTGLLTAAGDLQVGAFMFYVLSTFAMMFVSIFVSVMMQGALAGAISQGFLGRAISVRQAYRAALPCFWRLLRALLLIGLAIFLLCITIIGIPVAIFVGIRWALTVPPIVLENKRARAGLARSWELVQGHWWRVCGILSIATIGTYLVSVIPGFILGGALGAVLAVGGPNPTLVYVFSLAVGALFGILAAPIMPTISVLLYYDLRIRKEGFDMQILAASQTPPEPVIAPATYTA
jgi:hypothetical protein